MGDLDRIRSTAWCFAPGSPWKKGDTFSDAVPAPPQTIPLSPEVRLACSTLDLAFQDLKLAKPRYVGRMRSHAKEQRKLAAREYLGMRVSAAAFLVTKRALVFCEAAGLDHTTVLRRVEWTRHALKTWGLIQTAHPRDLEFSRVLPHHIRQIREGLARFGGITV